MSVVTSVELAHVDRQTPDPSAPFAGLVWLCDRTPIDSPYLAARRAAAARYNAYCALKRADRADRATLKAAT